MSDSEIFKAAVKLPPEQRAAFLDQSCGANQELRSEVESLLQAHDEAGSFLQSHQARPTATIAHESALESPGSRIGPYKLLQKLGEGGMGAVFLAEQEQPVKRRVALKIIKAGMDSAQVLARFEAERQALALMDHPNIARVLDAGTTSAGRPYFVMELVKGIPVTKFCDQERLTPKERLDLFIPVCQAVQHAHQKGIIHRDLKPSNVLIALYDGKPVPKVIDFGVAKATGAKLTEKTMFTEVGQLVGTLEYMAPEQAELNNLDIDTRADVYSLGVLLYELLTGGPPFTGKQLRSAVFTEMMRLIREVEPPKPSTKLSASEELPAIAAKRKLEPRKLTRLVHGDLDWIAMKALEKDRGRRYETANGLAQDIQRYLADEPVLAGPPGAGYRARKFLRRHKGPALAVAVALLALVLGIAGTTVGLVRARQAEATATEQRDQKAEAEKLAREEAEKARAVSKFLVDVFRSPDPEKDGRELKVAEMPDPAATRLKDEFTGPTAVKGELLSALGQTYGGLGLWSKAVEMHTQARAVRQAALGPDHLDTLKSCHLLAEAFRESGRVTEAVALFEATLERYMAKLGPDHLDTLNCMQRLAFTYGNDAGQRDKGIQLCEKTFELFKAKLGPDHLDTLGAVDDLGCMYVAAGRYAEGLPLCEKTFGRYKAKLGPDHHGTLLSMNNLAWAYSMAGRPKEAVLLFEQLLPLLQNKYGPDHPLRLTSMDSLVRVYHDTGQHAEALELCEKAFTLRKAKLGLNHPDTLVSMDTLGMSYLFCGRLTQAVQLFEDALRRKKEKLGPDHPDTLMSMIYLAVAYQQARRLTEALRLYEQAVPLQKAKLGPDHPGTLMSLARMARAYAEGGRLSEAVALAEEAVRLSKAKLLPQDSRTLRAMCSLALTYQAAGRLAEAVPLFEEALKHLKDQLGPDQVYTLRTRNNLARAYREAGRLADAQLLSEENVKLWKDKFGADHYELLNARNDLAVVYQEQGELDKAEALFLDVLALRKKNLPMEHRDVADTLSGLGLNYLQLKKYAEAEQMLVQAHEIFKKDATKDPAAYARGAVAHKRQTKALERLVQLYDAWEMKDKADEWRKKWEQAKAEAQLPGRT